MITRFIILFTLFFNISFGSFCGQGFKSHQQYNSSRYSGNFQIPQSKEGAAAIAIIGGIFLVVWAGYSLKYFYDYAFKDECKGERRFDLSIRQHYGSWRDFDSHLKSTKTYFSSQAINMNYSFFSTGPFGIGATMDLGYLGLKTIQSETQSTTYGSYFQVGPRFYFGDAQSYAYMDFLAGNAENSNVDFMATMRLGYDYGFYLFNQNFKIGADIGYTELDLNKKQGIINNHANGGFVFSGGIGAVF